jgi:transposase
MEIVLQILFYLGIDMGKESFFAYLMRSDGSKAWAKKFSNDEAGIALLVSLLGSNIDKCRAVIEATSRYHRMCERGLQNVGCRVDLVNPRKARALAQGLGFWDKDDQVDAHALALIAKLLEQKDEKLSSVKAQDLKDHSRTIDTLKRDAAKYMKRMEGLDKESDAYKACAEAVNSLKALAGKQERIWKKAVKEEPEIRRRYELAKTVPDVGHVTARCVSVELPADLEKSPRKLTAYAGLVPRRCQSGNKELPPEIYGGNSHLRTGVFMAAMHSVYFGKRNMPWYEILVARKHVYVRNKGGRHLKAIAAIMRKVLTNVIAVIKRDSPWTALPPCHSGIQAVPAASPTPIP